MCARAIRTTSSQKSRERINPGLMIQHRTRTLWIACWSVWTLLDVATARLGGSPVNASNAFDAPSDGLFESDLSSVEEEPGQTGRLVERRVDEVFCDHQDEDEIEVLIGYTSEKGRSRAKDMAARHGASGRSAHGRDRGEKEKDFAEIRAIAITTTKKDMKELELDEDIEYIEPDRELHMLANVVPYGIQMTQGSDRRVPRPANPANAGNCNNPSALRVAIIDSGIDGSHPDLPCSRNSGARCVGRSFVSDSWNNDLNSHGTHVAGTIAALGRNGRGVQGMVADGGICLVIGRVFPNSGGGASSSSILSAIQWAVEVQGAKVVSMSLGGPGYSTTEDRFYQALSSSGVIVVAAAGNSGSNQFFYPASYGSVVSVAAVDSNRNRAPFSQYNSQIDLSAPGVGILSTIPSTYGGLSTLTVPGRGPVLLEKMRYSVNPTSPRTSGPLVNCGQGNSPCPGGSGQVCLIERGGDTFEQKATNCQSGGGVAAIIFNNVDGMVDGALSSSTGVTIPTLGATRVDGLNLQGKFLGNTTTVEFETGYATYDGTSMATPHVSGAVASIWRVCRQCRNDQVIQCLRTTAIDLGPAGYDVLYGHGLIRTRAAYTCLRRSCCA